MVILMLIFLLFYGFGFLLYLVCKRGRQTEGKRQGKVISIHFEHVAIYIFLKLFLLYHNHFNARALIGQSAMGYCAGKPMEKSRVF